MSLGDGSVWDENNPQQSTIVNQGPLYETDFKVAVRSRMANEHIWPINQSSTASAGQHLYITFQGQTGIPTMPLIGTTTQAAMLYADTNSNLIFQNSSNQTRILITATRGVNITGGVYSSTGLAGEILVGSSGGNVVILAPATTSGQALIATSGAAPAWGFPQIFGTWTSTAVLGSAYLAPTDGLVVALAGMNVSGRVQGFSDSNANPTTTRCSQYVSVPDSGTITMPVRKGDYYKVIISSGSGNATIFWLPIGQ